MLLGDEHRRAPDELRQALIAYHKCMNERHTGAPSECRLAGMTDAESAAEHMRALRRESKIKRDAWCT